ncbi:MAG: T9SS type A sorting domain-containing protein [Candidatus Cloacimonetes bacterium]|nr:T9SS type A sorting domain-containing protein [Candidatus Cloacimonadota bacterium]
MKRTLVFALLLILAISFGSTVFAQTVPVTIGDGTNTNTTTGPPAPYGTWYKAFRQQFLVLASEFNDAGGGGGDISSLAFNVSALNNCTPMPNYRIRLKHTSQTTLSGTFEEGDYQEVFQADSFMPTTGWNEHTFSAPFNWDGNSNILVDIVTDIIDGSYAQNASVFYTNTSFNSALRYQNDSNNGDTGIEGTPGVGRSNMVFTMQQLDVLDMIAVAIDGPNSPSINSTVNYTVTVKSLCRNPVSDYTVKLMKAPEFEIASIDGTEIQFMEELDYTLSWTPDEEGGFELFGRVIMDDDEDLTNDDTPMLAVTVMPEGLAVVSIGDGTQVNTTSSVPTPYGTYYKNFRQQYLITANEINNAGGGPGEMYGVSWNVDNLNNCSPMPNYRIRIKHTTQTELTATFETGDYQQVFQDDSFMPVQGWNFHPFSTPFNWDGASNLLIDVVCDMVSGWTQNASVFYTNTGFNSSLRFQNDNNPADESTTGTVSTNRSNLRLTMQQLDMQDMAALSITGSTTPSVDSPTNYTVRVKNLSLNEVTDYTVMLMEAPNLPITSTPGTAIGPMEELEFVLEWTPDTVGITHLYGRVEMLGDENFANDETPLLEVEVFEAGTTIIVIGNDTTTNTATGTPTPYGTYYKNFRQQYLWRADEISSGRGSPGLITSLAFNVDDTNNCLPMPDFTIKMKTTDEDLLTSTFELGEYTEVFYQDGYVPDTGWSIHELSTPFFWDGESNILVDIHCTIFTEAYTRNASVFYTATPGENTALRYQSDGTNAGDYPTGTTSTYRANVRFGMILEDTGSLSGTVTANGVPLPEATVSVDNTVFSTITADDGSYSLPFVPTGDHTVIASKYGYNDVSHEVTILPDQNTVQDFEMTQLPTVTVTGRIVGSDQPTVGLADASISLTGFENYDAITDDDGQFSIAGVYYGHTYEYTAKATGYQNAVGEVVVGDTNVDMGDIVVNEIAFRPRQVLATEAADFSNVEVSWMPPDPDAVGEWVYYCGEKYDGIGTGSAADFDVAIRFPASALEEYAGMSLFAVKAWPAQAGDFSIRVWTGGNASAPGPMVVDQPFIPAPLDEWNTVLLNYPVNITGTEELWFGYRCNVASGYPAGCDAGPAINGLGNMMYFQGEWDTLLGIAPTLNYNWNIQGYIGYSAPNRAPVISALSLEGDRAMTGYHVYRFLAENQNDQLAWDQLTPSIIDGTSYIDNDWAPLPAGVYKYAVKAVYTNNVMSTPAFSNEIHKSMIATLVGTVTDFGTNDPIEGAIVTAGAYSGITNAQGEYSFEVYQGNYDVSCTMLGYHSVTQDDVDFVGGETITLDFVLTEITLPPLMVQAEEANPNLVNISWLDPESGENIIEDFEGDEFPPEGWEQIINNPNVSGAGVMASWCRVGTIALDPPVIPHSGDYQAAMWWDYDHQDEWLITPQFLCPPASDLVFWSYVYLGSTHGDQYNINVSQDDGNTWTPIWEASALTGGWNYYEYPIEVNLDDYAGQEIKLAWQAIDGDGQGLWYIWFVDDVSVGNSTEKINFAANTLTRVSKSNGNRTNVEVVTPSLPISRDTVFGSQTNKVRYTLPQTRNNRARLGYRVWRLPVGEENNESAWVLLTSENTADEQWQDTGWGSVLEGEYRWAVKAVYSGNLLSNPAFSNILEKEQHGVTPVVLSSFTAIVTTENEVKVTWVTQSEQNQLGYRIYRSENSTQDDALLITPVLIPATNTSVEHSYHHVDPEVENAHSYYYWLESVDPSMSQFFGPVSVTVSFDVPPVLPEISSLKNAYPNPFKQGAGTNIGIDIKAGETGTLSIYNIQGQVVKTVSLAEGSHKLVWNGRDNKGKVCGSGIYFYKLSTPSLNQTKKMILMK